MGCDALIPSLGDFEYVLTVVGLLGVIKHLALLLWAVGNGVRTYFWSRLWQKKLVEDYGKWAGELESPSKWKVASWQVTLSLAVGVSMLPCPSWRTISRHRSDTGLMDLTGNNCVSSLFLVAVTVFACSDHFPSCGTFASCNPVAAPLSYIFTVPRCHLGLLSPRNGKVMMKDTWRWKQLP